MAQNNYDGAMQRPIGTGLGATSVTTDIIKGTNLEGKVVIVTGGNSGIGLETAKTLAGAGAQVIVPARDVEKARKNLAGIANVEIEELDLINPGSIDAFAERFLSSGRKLDLLINNAGIMFVPLRRDQDGNESQLSVNFLSVFRLTARLFEALKKADGARVINVSSLGHHFAPFSFDDPNFEQREYNTLQAYGQSKTAVNLFSLELDERAKAFGIRAYALHPGNVWGTDLAREAPVEILQQFGFIDDAGNIIQATIDTLKTVPQGAATTVWAATSPQLNERGGVYLEDGDIAELAVDAAMPGGVKAYSLEKASAQKLWVLAEELTDLKFNIN